MQKMNNLMHPHKQKNPKFTPVLNGVNLSIKRNSFTTILGANGCGKSTLIKAIINQLSPYQGTIH